MLLNEHFWWSSRWPQTLHREKSIRLAKFKNSSNTWRKYHRRSDDWWRSKRYNGSHNDRRKESTDSPPEEEVKKKTRKPIVQVIGYVESIRKIITKKWENMLIVMCSSTGWKFTAIVFPKVYNQIAHLFKEGEIVLVKGKLNCKIEMKEISIEADQVKRSSISDLRTAAQNDGLFGDGDILFPTLQNKYNCIVEEKILPSNSLMKQQRYISRNKGSYRRIFSLKLSCLDWYRWRKIDTKNIYRAQYRGRWSTNINYHTVVISPRIMIFPNSVLFVLECENSFIWLQKQQTIWYLYRDILTTHLSSRAMIGRYEESTIYIPPERFYREESRAP